MEKPILKYEKPILRMAFWGAMFYNGLNCPGAGNTNQRHVIAVYSVFSLSGLNWSKRPYS
jgi:hypothetical protein